ncbi:MAG: HEPN domain-containing protein [Anaerolineales bacterium]|nr:HEPN domain-containing protein [Anaerolineales bacterium]
MNNSDPLFDKAERYIRSAKLLSDDGDFDSAASRLYYAMFFIAEALLNKRGLSFSSHHAVIAAFGQYFAKTKELDPRFHQSLLAAFSQRQLGDYSNISVLTRKDIEILLKDTTDFLAASKKWISNLN